MDTEKEKPRIAPPDQSGIGGDGGGQLTEVGHPYDGEGGVRRGVERDIQREKDKDKDEEEDIPFEPPD